MITSSTYFKGSIAVPNAEDTAPNSNLLGNVTELKTFIEEYELDVTTKCFGYSLNKAFRSNLEVLDPATGIETMKPSADQKWKDLFSGKEYTKDDVLVNWRGLVFKDGTFDRSLLAYYVFPEFLKNDMSSYGRMGMQIEKAKKSMRSQYNRLYVDSYNKFYDLAVGFNIESVKDNSGLRSLYQFIEDMNDLDPATYPDWLPYTFPKVNIFGI